jgi:hypothetical protein
MIVTDLSQLIVPCSLLAELIFQTEHLHLYIWYAEQHYNMFYYLIIGWHKIPMSNNFSHIICTYCSMGFWWKLLSFLLMAWATASATGQTSLLIAIYSIDTYLLHDITTWLVTGGGVAITGHIGRIKTGLMDEIAQQDRLWL